MKNYAAWKKTVDIVPTVITTTMYTAHFTSLLRQYILLILHYYCNNKHGQ